jgi:hypothetical protein
MLPKQPLSLVILSPSPSLRINSAKNLCSKAQVAAKVEILRRFAPQNDSFSDDFKQDILSAKRC